MKRHKFAGVILALLLFGGCFAALAAGGTSSDPLVTLNYLEGTYLPAVKAQMETRAQNGTSAVYKAAEATLTQRAQALLAQVGSSEAAAPGLRKLKREDTVTLPAGSGILWLSGSARIKHSGTVVDVTTGSVVASGGELTANHRYLAAEDTTATVTVSSEAATATLQGAAVLSPSAVTAMPFTDVRSGDWFQPAVRYVYEKGLFKGTSETEFSPHSGMNRAMLATVLYRLAGSPAVTGLSNPFRDVSADAYYGPAVIWAASNKIVEGKAAGVFDPNGQVSREQMAAMLYRYATEYARLPATERAELSVFPDGGRTAAWALDAMKWAVGREIIQGSDGYLQPQSVASRCQVAAMLQRFSALL